MSREEIYKLVGGYATGTLTPEEREALFTAALEDQELFDALAREQALRDLLGDPASKASLLAALSERPLPWYRRIGWLRPLAVGVAMASATGLALLVLKPRQAPVQVASAPASAPPLVAEVKPSEPQRPPAARAESAPAQSGPLKSGKAVASLRDSNDLSLDKEEPRRSFGARAAKSEVRADVKAKDATPPPTPQPALAAAPPPPPPPPARPAAVPATGQLAEQIAVPAPSQQQAQQQVQVTATAGAVSQDAIQAGARSTVVVAETDALRGAAGGRGGRVAPGAAGSGGGGGGANGPATGALQLYNLASGSGMVGGITAFRALATTNSKVAPGRVLALRYTFLRRTSSGASPIASPSERKPGETLEVQFVAADDGYLTVTRPDGAPLVAAVPLIRLQPLTVPLPDGPLPLSATYSIQPLAKFEEKSAAAPADLEAARQVAPQPLQETIAGITYVGLRTQAREMRFTIDGK